MYARPETFAIKSGGNVDPNVIEIDPLAIQKSPNGIQTGSDGIDIRSEDIKLIVSGRDVESLGSGEISPNGAEISFSDAIEKNTDGTEMRDGGTKLSQESTQLILGSTESSLNVVEKRRDDIPINTSLDKMRTSQNRIQTTQHKQISQDGKEMSKDGIKVNEDGIKMSQRDTISPDTIEFSENDTNLDDTKFIIDGTKAIPDLKVIPDDTQMNPSVFNTNSFFTIEKPSVKRKRSVSKDEGLTEARAREALKSSGNQRFTRVRHRHKHRHHHKAGKMRPRANQKHLSNKKKQTNLPVWLKQRRFQVISKRNRHDGSVEITKEKFISTTKAKERTHKAKSHKRKLHKNRQKTKQRQRLYKNYDTSSVEDDTRWRQSEKPDVKGVTDISQKKRAVEDNNSTKGFRRRGFDDVNYTGKFHFVDSDDDEKETANTDFEKTVAKVLDRSGFEVAKNEKVSQRREFKDRSDTFIRTHTFQDARLKLLEKGAFAAVGGHRTFKTRYFENNDDDDYSDKEKENSQSNYRRFVNPTDINTFDSFDAADNQKQTVPKPEKPKTVILKKLNEELIKRLKSMPNKVSRKFMSFKKNLTFSSEEDQEHVLKDNIYKTFGYRRDISPSFPIGR